MGNIAFRRASGSSNTNESRSPSNNYCSREMGNVKSRRDAGSNNTSERSPSSAVRSGKMGNSSDTNKSSPSDLDGMHLFRLIHAASDQGLMIPDPTWARKLIKLKHNDPGTKNLELQALFCDQSDDAMSENKCRLKLKKRMCRRLGDILGQNEYVEDLIFRGCNLNMEELCIGLQNNRSIKQLWLYDARLENAEEMSNLARFLVNNPSLKMICLPDCNLGADGINVLSNSLSNQTLGTATLESLNLPRNHFGDIDLDELVQGLKSTDLVSLDLSSNGLGQRACTSLAKLLQSEESSLEHLNLSYNSIANDSVVILEDSLVKNTRLKKIEMSGNNLITAPGWTALLKLVCINHTINNLGISYAHNMQAVKRALAVNDAEFIRAALNLNGHINKTLGTRCKIIWGHIRGKLNMADSSAAAIAMPQILEWIGNHSSETNTILIRYHQLLLPVPNIDTIRCELIYHIIKSMPELLHNGTFTQGCDPSQDSKHKLDMIIDLDSESKKLCNEDNG